MIKIISTLLVLLPICCQPTCNHHPVVKNRLLIVLATRFSKTSVHSKKVFTAPISFFGSFATWLIQVILICMRLLQASDVSHTLKKWVSPNAGVSLTENPTRGQVSGWLASSSALCPGLPTRRPAPAGSSPPWGPARGEKVETSLYRRAGVQLSSLASPREART